MSPVRRVPSSGNRIAIARSSPSGRLRSLWISWNNHRRTTGLCAAWDVPLLVVGSERSGLGRWIDLALQTIAILRSHKPDILFVQNPSLALTILASVSRTVFRFYLVVDAHNEGVRPFERPGRVVRWLTRRLLRAADTTIVTNASLAKDVEAAGGRPLVLPDAIPLPPSVPATIRRAEDAPHIAVIATFRRDEPIAAIIAAAATMPEVRFAISGAAARFRKQGIPLPANVQLTGFLPDPAYWKLLAKAEVICDLTLKTDCLVCGAYEALALAKPMILSDNPPTRDIFGPAAILTGPEPDDIATAVRAALQQHEQLAANAHRLRETFRTNWQPQSAAAWNAILAGATRKRSWA
jgi:glycosyltransferase involved in cell wall biosynthesis